MMFKKPLSPVFLLFCIRAAPCQLGQPDMGPIKPFLKVQLQLSHCQHMEHNLG